MPNGRLRSAVYISLISVLLPSFDGRITRTRFTRLSATKMSPFGATRMSRGFFRPAVNSSTLNPEGTTGNLPAGRGMSLGPFSTDSVRNGLGMSAGVMRRRTPGASVVQSPAAPWPVKTFVFCGLSDLPLDCDHIDGGIKTHILTITMRNRNAIAGLLNIYNQFN